MNFKKLTLFESTTVFLFGMIVVATLMAFGITKTSTMYGEHKASLYVITKIHETKPMKINLHDIKADLYYFNVKVGAHCTTLGTVIHAGDTVALVRESGVDDNGFTYEYFVGVQESLGCQSNW